VIATLALNYSAAYSPHNGERDRKAGHQLMTGLSWFKTSRGHFGRRLFKTVFV
jgi:hypothetical protein